jgi:ABC-type nitrate/sulfonate/bicarbonate transport system substrate-binding protein
MYLRSSQKILLACIALLLVGMLFGIFYPQKPPSVTVQLKWKHNTQFAGMYVALAKGFYKEVGLEVELHEYTTASSTVSAKIAKGKATFGIVSANEFLSSIEKEHDILAVAALYQVSPTAIASLASARIAKISDLVGKKIGLTSLDPSATLFVEGMLARAQIDPKAVTYVNVGFNQVEALLAREVDAVVLYRTNSLYPLDKKGVRYAVLTPEAEGISLYNDILITSRAFHSANEEVTEKFMAATRKGWEYAFEHQDEAVDITYQWTEGTYRDKDYLMHILKNAHPLMVPKDAPERPIGYMSPGVWDETYDLYHTHKLVGELEIYRYFIPRYFFE